MIVSTAHNNRFPCAGRNIFQIRDEHSSPSCRAGPPPATFRRNSLMTGFKLIELSVPRAATLEFELRRQRGIRRVGRQHSFDQPAQFHQPRLSTCACLRQQGPELKTPQVRRIRTRSVDHGAVREVNARLVRRRDRVLHGASADDPKGSISISSACLTSAGFLVAAVTCSYGLGTYPGAFLNLIDELGKSIGLVGESSQPGRPDRFLLRDRQPWPVPSRRSSECRRVSEQLAGQRSRFQSLHIGASSCPSRSGFGDAVRAICAQAPFHPSAAVTTSYPLFAAGVEKVAFILLLLRRPTA